MKILSKEEERAHYDAVLRGGAVGGVVGLGIGWGGVLLASRRYQAFRALTLPFKTFLVSSSATFGALVNADRWSVDFQRRRDPAYGLYRSETGRTLDEARAARSPADLGRLLDWGREHRYTIVFASWVAAMGLALAVVGRNRYLTTAQKVVQARVYAQGLTLAVLIATAAFEVGDAQSGKGRWETVMVIDPDDPEHKHLIEKRIHKEDYEGQDLWKDMVAAEERRLSSKKERNASKAAPAKQ